MKATAMSFDHITDRPKPGKYLGKLVKSGPMIPIELRDVSWRNEDGELMEDERFELLVCGQPSDAPEHIWPYLCRQPVSDDEYEYQLAKVQWANEYAPYRPEANPRQPVNIDDLPPAI